MSYLAKNTLLLLFTLTLFACSQSGKVSAPYSVNHSNTQSGIASYYADKYQSRPTASGEPFDQSKATAAHKTLPFGTLVRVRNIRNHRIVVVRINDRGPFVRGRIIDLSKSAFSAIENPRAGVVDVEIQILK